MAKSIKQLWNQVSNGGQASIEMAVQAIEAYYNHDGALQKAEQVLLLSKEQPVYHKAFVSILTACVAINKGGERVKLTDKAKEKRVVNKEKFLAKVESGEYRNIIDLVRGKKDDDKPVKSAFAKANTALKTASNILSAEDASGSEAELEALVAQAKAILAQAAKLEEVAKRVGIDGDITPILDVAVGQ